MIMIKLTSHSPPFPFHHILLPNLVHRSTHCLAISRVPLPSMCGKEPTSGDRVKAVSAYTNHRAKSSNYHNKHIYEYNVSKCHCYIASLPSCHHSIAQKKIIRPQSVYDIL